MRNRRHDWLMAALLALLGALIGWQVTAQQPPAQSTPPPASRPANPPAVVAPTPRPIPNTVAATVNGQPIMEVAVQRGLKRWPPDAQAQVRGEIINYLVDKTIVDQYLAQQNVPVSNEDIDAKLKLIRDELQKSGGTVDKVMKDLYLSETELRTEIAGQLRWEKLLTNQANEKVLRDLFDNNKEMFDYSQVRCRHILLGGNDAKELEQSKAKLLAIKKQIEDAVTLAVSKVPANADALAREKERTKVMDESFAAIAMKESTCPSKAQGGDLGFFPRAGSMVEPFAVAAFRLKPHQLSDPVVTQYGVHLMLVIDRKPGRDVKFEDVKDEVKDAYGDRLREAIVAKYRPAAKIAVNPPPAPQQ